MMDEKQEEYGISSAGVEYVEVHLPTKDDRDFFQQLVQERPELDEKLVYLHLFINRNRREGGQPEKTIRETVYDLLEYVVNQWVEQDKDVQSLTSKAREENG